MINTKLAVLGNPVAHSLSPNIFSLFAAQMQQSIDYQPVFVDAGEFPSTVASLIDDDYLGCNVTLPYKSEAFALADHHDPLAFAAKAANVLRFDNQGYTFAYNTDGLGLIASLQQHCDTLKGKHILLLGAGGAAQGCLLPLLQQQPETLTIANRTVSRAETLAEQFLPHGHVHASRYDKLNQTYDIIINATSTGITDIQLPLPKQIISNHTLCLEMMYGKTTLFMKWATRHGATAIDGLEMLVAQAVESYAIWFDRRPDGQAALTRLREASDLPVV